MDWLFGLSPGGLQMFQQAAISCFALLLPSGLAAQSDSAAPLDSGGTFLLILILTGAGLLAVRKERR
jgi:hypothetical protein